MPLARTFDSASKRVVTTLHQAYLDRVSRWSDIQEHMPCLREAARSYPKARILELGSRTGNSTLAFLAGAEESDGHVWSCDIDNIITRSDGMKPWANCKRWTFIHGSDMDLDIYAKLPREVDVLFIDTSHEYRHTLDELDAYVPRVVKGGVVLLHDTQFLFTRPGEIHDGSIPPVARALDEYCRKTGRKWANLPEGYGLGILEIGG